MKSVAFAAIAVCTMSLVGCGPMGSGPMPPRLEADEQKKIDDSWNQALTPPDRLDPQATLDALILSQAYQVGVDRLSFRSEKDFSGGTVVMEIHFDRTKPNDDRFEMKILDKTGVQVRQLVYNRDEVEKAYRELNDSKFASPRGANEPPLAPDDVKKREEVQKRIAAIEKVFPKQEPNEQLKK
jgi:hypothetical protein